MKYPTTALATAALLSLIVPVSAQMYPTSPTPQPAQGYYTALWPEMMDNGSSSDFPTHTPSDFVADQLNRQVLNYNAGPIYVPR
jgi:hypothetical protein